MSKDMLSGSSVEHRRDSLVIANTTMERNATMLTVSEKPKTRAEKRQYMTLKEAKEVNFQGKTGGYASASTI